jgi:hypothetical protein
MNSDTIALALSEIRANYELYSANAKKAAERYSFDKAMNPYLTYLEEELLAS